MPKIKLTDSTRWMGIDYDPGDDVEVPLELAQALGHYLEENTNTTSSEVKYAQIDIDEPTTWMGVEYTSGKGVTVPIELAQALGAIVQQIPAQIALLNVTVSFLGSTYVLTQAVNLTPEQVTELTKAIETPTPGTDITSSTALDNTSNIDTGSGESISTGETVSNEVTVEDPPPPTEGGKRRK